MPRLSSRTVVRRAALVEDDAAARERARGDDRRGDQPARPRRARRSAERDQPLQRVLERRRVQQRRDVERQQAGEGQRGAGDPVQVAQRGRREHVAPRDRSHSARPAVSAGRRHRAGRREVGAVDRADARADDDVRALGLAAARAAAPTARRPRRRRVRRRRRARARSVGVMPALLRTASRKARAVGRWARSSSCGETDLVRAVVAGLRQRGPGEVGRARLGLVAEVGGQALPAVAPVGRPHPGRRLIQNPLRVDSSDWRISTAAACGQVPDVCGSNSSSCRSASSSTAATVIRRGHRGHQRGDELARAVGQALERRRVEHGAVRAAVELGDEARRGRRRSGACAPRRRPRPGGPPRRTGRARASPAACAPRRSARRPRRGSCRARRRGGGRSFAAAASTALRQNIGTTRAWTSGGSRSGFA